MLRSYLVFTVGLIAVQPLLLAAQTGAMPEPQVTLEDVVATTKIYFRDTAQFPMLQHTLLTVTDTSGKVLKSAIASNVHSIFPEYVMLAGQARGTLTIVNRADDGVLTARLQPSFECPAFAFSAASLYMPAIICGEGKIDLRPDLSMQRFVFDQGGLPASTKVGPFGKTVLQSFHVEIDFQEVTVSPDPEPYIVPERITSTLVTAKGTLSIVSDYSSTSPGTLKNRMML